ncbi:MAG: hypothetical protein JO290_08790 [Sphingomonadaceae bacterium]|nr:hypothetical protein [Sphingomonadaceae bacterium]
MIVTPDRIVVAATVAVAAGLMIAAGPLVADLTRDDGRALAAIAPAPPLPPLDLAPLKRLAPFGRAAGGDGAGLGLTLRGVLLARPASRSVALIAAGEGPAKGYGVGGVLPGGAVVDAVEYDLVVLRAGGDLVTLGLDHGTGAAAPAATIAAAAPTPAPAAATAPDPLSLLGSLGATVTAAGYRVGPQLSADARRAGLLPGDIVERVGGDPVGDPARDRRLYDDAVVAGRMQVDVVRDGRRVAVILPLH